MILEKFYKNTDFFRWQKHRKFTKITDENINLYLPIYQKDVLCRDRRCNECSGDFPVYDSEEDILNGMVRHRKCLRYEEQKKENIRIANSNRYLKNLKVPKKYRSTTWGGLDKVKPQAIKEVQNYINNFPLNTPTGLYIYGESNGSGKTSLLWMIMQKLISMGRLGQNYIFKKVGLFTQELTQDFDIKDNNFFEKCLSCELVVIDDFGRERYSEFISERMYTILDSRSEQDLPTILASHIPLYGSVWVKDRERDILSRIKRLCKVIEIED